MQRAEQSPCPLASAGKAATGILPVRRAHFGDFVSLPEPHLGNPSLMAIDVTCASCKTRFQVSDKFAGKQGPCPKCKKIITVPTKKDEVVIHVPESGPKDSKGVLV